METYRLTASALLRLASIAAQAPGVDADEVLSLVQCAVPIAPLVSKHAEPAEDGGPSKPAKPE